MIGPAVWRTNWGHGGPPDNVYRRTTFIFGKKFPNQVRPDLYYRNPDQEPNDVDMLLNIVGPVSRMVTDGTGRRVMDFNAVGDEFPWL